MAALDRVTTRLTPDERAILAQLMRDRGAPAATVIKQLLHERGRGSTLALTQLRGVLGQLDALGIAEPRRVRALLDEAADLAASALSGVASVWSGSEPARGSIVDDMTATASRQLAELQRRAMRQMLADGPATHAALAEVAAATVAEAVTAGRKLADVDRAVGALRRWADGGLKADGATLHRLSGELRAAGVRAEGEPLAVPDTDPQVAAARATAVAGTLRFDELRKLTRALCEHTHARIRAYAGPVLPFPVARAIDGAALEFRLPLAEAAGARPGLWPVDEKAGKAAAQARQHAEEARNRAYMDAELARQLSDPLAGP